MARARSSEAGSALESTYLMGRVRRPRSAPDEAREIERSAALATRQRALTPERSPPGWSSISVLTSVPETEYICLQGVLAITP
jgi:hypothetical protein